MILPRVAPSARAASTNSFSRSDKVAPRTSRAGVGHEKNAMIRMTSRSPGLRRPLKQPSSEVAIARSLREDLYVVHAGYNEDQTKAVVQAYVNPLVQWVWIGGVVMILGTLVSMLPPLRNRQRGGMA